MFGSVYVSPESGWKYVALIEHDEIMSASNAAVFNTSIIGLAIAVLFALGGWKVAKSMTDPIIKSGAFTRQVAGGDLTASISVKGKDEVAVLASDLSEMGTALRGVVSDVRTTVDGVAAGSVQLSATAESLSQAATEQAANVEEGRFVHGANGLEHQPECGECERNRTDRPELGRECGTGRPIGRPDRGGHARDRPTRSPSSRRSPGRPTCWP